MESPLDRLFEFAAKHPDREVKPTYEFDENLCYCTKGAADRLAGLREFLVALHSSIQRQDYEGAEKWSNDLATRLSLEHNVPPNIRAVLAEIYYDLALTPGMDNGLAQTFASMFARVVWYVHLPGLQCFFTT